MNYNKAIMLAQKHNQEKHGYTIGVLRHFGTITGIPVITGIFIIKEDDPNNHHTSIEDAAEHGEKIMQNIMSKT